MIIKQIAGIVVVCMYMPLWSAQAEAKRRFEHVVTEAEILNPTTPDGMLLQGINKKRYSQVTKALELGAHVDVRFSANKCTALMEAAQDYSTSSIAELLIRSKADVNAQNKQGLTPLMHACTNESDVVTQSLLDNRANIDAVDNRKNNAFCYAIYHRKLANVNLLIKRGCDINSFGEFGNTNLIVAAHQGYSDLICVLLSCNADPFIKNTSGDTVLGYAQAGFKKQIANEGDALRFKQTVKVLEDYNVYSEAIYKAAAGPLDRIVASYLVYKCPAEKSL